MTDSSLYIIHKTQYMKKKLYVFQPLKLITLHNRFFCRSEYIEVLKQIHHSVVQRFNKDLEFDK